ncbi:nucleotide-diphospho-sugar transferase [Scenedesmus sp. NREL 46B-D3]|nr:nucleotide-diphospho-sugar transferase [Scenedesmus sp. NREL 46B-D3]
MPKLSKLAARAERLRWQTQELMKAVFTIRVTLLVLAATVLWRSGSFTHSRCSSVHSASAAATRNHHAALEQQRIQLGRAAAAYDAGPGRVIRRTSPVYSDVPGYIGPPYIIPKFIHQTVEDRTAMSCQVRESVQTWIDMNPGYVHRLYDARDRLEFVQQHYPQLLDLFIALPTNVERADFWRYLALHKLGGVYTDSDVRCMQPISSWNAEHGHDAALLAGIAKRTAHGDTTEFNQFVMAAMPGHPVLASMPLIIASSLASTFLQGHGVSRQGKLHDAGVLGRTGPGAFTAALRHYNVRVGGHWPINSTRADQLGGILFGTVRAMPKFVLGMGWETIDYNMTCDQVKQKVRTEAYICHQFFGTWKKQPEVSTNLTYSNCATGLRYAEHSSSSSSSQEQRQQQPRAAAAVAAGAAAAVKAFTAV